MSEEDRMLDTMVKLLETQTALCKGILESTPENFEEEHAVSLMVLKEINRKSEDLINFLSGRYMV
jgi:hypothetical protein|tara:strand:- start:483 stop:677 length:195 start_codon:yes stop_codon:yes gene_type:complete